MNHERDNASQCFDRYSYTGDLHMYVVSPPKATVCTIEGFKTGDTSVSSCTWSSGQSELVREPSHDLQK
jgi:hypothetical protein